MLIKLKIPKTILWVVNLFFIFLLIFFAVSTLNQRIGWKPLSVLGPVVFVVWPVYLWLEMKTFYSQGWLKTTIKFALLNVLGLLIMLLLFLFFLLFSIVEL